jgi:hypothetical protein
MEVRKFSNEEIAHVFSTHPSELSAGGVQKDCPFSFGSKPIPKAPWWLALVYWSLRCSGLGWLSSEVSRWQMRYVFWGWCNSTPAHPDPWNQPDFKPCEGECHFCSPNSTQR